MAIPTEEQIYSAIYSSTRTLDQMAELLIQVNAYVSDTFTKVRTQMAIQTNTYTPMTINQINAQVSLVAADVQVAVTSLRNLQQSINDTLSENTQNN